MDLKIDCIFKTIFQGNLFYRCVFAENKKLTCSCLTTAKWSYNSFLRLFLPLLLALYVLTFPVYSYSSELRKNLEEPSQTKSLVRMAILPVENLSNYPMASQLVSKVLKKELQNSYNVSLIEENIVDKFISNRRIRYTGALSKLLARDMGNDLGIDRIMIISIDLFEETPTQVIVGLTSRLISAVDGNIIWSNSVAYSGRDFQRFLGLGIVESIETLSSIVISELISNFPNSYIPASREVIPFEVGKVRVFPDVGKSNEKIDLSVELENFDRDPLEVRAIIGGRETVLSKWKRSTYKGSLIAPAVEGPYHVDVIAVDRFGTPYSFKSVCEVTIDNTPPPISLALNRTVFAPKNKGYITFTPDLQGFEKINEWVMEIVDETGKLINSSKGYGMFPKKFIWRGRTNKMSIVSDGKYEYIFKVKDEAGNETVLVGDMKVNHKPPVINVDVDIDEDTLEFTFDKDGSEELESWQFSMLQNDGNILKHMSGKNNLPQKIKFPLKDNIEISSLAFSVDTTDRAGNTFALKKSISNYISKGKVPFARLREINNSIENF